MTVNTVEADSKSETQVDEERLGGNTTAESRTLSLQKASPTIRAVLISSSADGI